MRSIPEFMSQGGSVSISAVKPKPLTPEIQAQLDRAQRALMASLDAALSLGTPKPLPSQPLTPVQKQQNAHATRRFMREVGM